MHRITIAATAIAGCVLGAVVAMLIAPPASAAGSPCGATVNPIACENRQSGTSPAIWDIDGAGSDSIQGFATDISVNVGASIDFKILTPARSYSIDIYRLGYYGGNGARFITAVSPSVPLPQSQLPCAVDSSTLNFDCGTWAVSAHWAVPSTAVSGVYIAKLTRTDQPGDPQPDSSHITFIVRNDASTSDIVFQTSDQTWQAYNTYGGSDFYTGTDSLTGSQARAFKISYNRPFATRNAVNGRDFLFSNEYPTIRYLEENGYDVSYISGIDTDRYGATLLTKHKVFMSVGHDEYWSLQQRTNVENARDAGVSLMFLSGNEVYWRTRFEPSIDGSSTSYRTLVCSKDTWDNAQIDLTGESTATWRDPRFAAAPGGSSPENALTGTLYMSNNTDLALTVTKAEAQLRLWRGTGLNSMTGPSTVLAPHTIGYESDEDLDNGFRPEGLIRLSTTTGATPQYLTDFGSVVVPGTTTHHLTLYRAPSGALVFGAGTIQWGWGLDANHDGSDGTPADPRMRQATMNMLADMGAQPSTRAAGLAAAAKSTDTSGPTAAISSPPAGAIANGATVTVSGTAADAGGGQVAGVEVSLDGGSSWHPAQGAATWTYTGVLHGDGASAILARAIDDSANIQSPPSAQAITVSCPCSVFGTSAPKVPDAGDASATELGMRFSSSADGYVTGIRFYKAAANTGSHVGTLWDANGSALASGSFGAETPSGWQTLTFASPVGITAGTSYVASYSAPNGHYAADSSFFYYEPVVAAPLSADATTPDLSRVNGLYGSSLGRFPTATYKATNYYVDPVFVTGAVIPPSVVSQTPSPNSSSVPPTLAPSVVFSKTINQATLSFALADVATGQPVPGSTTYDAPARRATFTPSSPLAAATQYRATVTATDTNGNAMPAPSTWTFETAFAGQAGGACPCSLFPDSTAPATASVTDSASVELGVTFTADTAGIVTGVRFYKGPQNIGTHTGSLWSAAGALLATGTFSAESASGWQTLLFSTPIAIEAGTRYVASYRTAVGHYAATAGGLAAGVDRFPLHAVPGGALYTYGAGFPINGSSTDYGVDVLFTVPNSVVPTVIATSPADGDANVLPSATVAATFSTSLTADTAAISLSGANGPVAGSTSLDALHQVVTFTPATPLTAGITYTATISGARSLAGIAQSADVVLHFTAAGGGGAMCPCSLFPSTALPATADSGDGGAVTIGTQFIPLETGYITALRYYKSAANTGAHTGSIWSSTGTRLASAAFDAESTAGWQTAQLDAPLQVSAGTTYVISYFAPSGHYSITTQYFATQYTRGPLTVPAGNGRFVYGSDAFPNSSFANANYWVDVVFNQGAAPASTPPTVQSTTPISGASSVPPSVTPTVTFSKAVDPASIAIAVSAQGGPPLAGSIAYDASSRTASWTPSSPLSAATGYTAVVTAVDSAGTPIAGANSWTFTTQAAPAVPGVCPCMLWDDTATPADVAHPDPLAVELGVRFSADADGFVTGVRFYKGPQNTGAHAGSLWDANGTRLATATFQGESSTGWQSVQFPSPVFVTAGTTYLASYQTPTGYYSVDGGAIGSAGFNAAPLHALAHGGSFVYGSGFPANSSDANYWVTPVFQQGAAPSDTSAPVISAVAAAPSGTGATITWSTDEPATSVVLYGTAPSALSSTATGPAGVTAHSVALGALASGTTYFYQVSSADPAGNSATAPTTAATFTSADTVAPVIIAISQTPTATTATVSWTTDEASSSVVLYGTSAGALSGTATAPGAVTAHSVDLSGLAPATTYYFQVSSADAAGNRATAPSAPATFVTLDATAPVISTVAAVASGTTATVTWTTDEASTSVVSYGTGPTTLSSTATSAGLVTAHSVTLTGLAALTRYYYRVTSVDAAGNSATSPAGLSPAASFAPDVAPMVDTSAADFTAGTASSTTVSDYDGGELIITPALSADFAGAALPSGFASSAVVSGGTTTVSGGNATILGATLSTSSSYTSGRSVDVRVTLRQGQSLGWVSTSSANVRAAFSVNSSGQLIATVNDGGANNVTSVAASGWTAIERSLRIDWTSSAVTFFLDGNQVYTRAYAPSNLFRNHRPFLTDPVRTDGGMVVDYLRLAPYAASGTFQSRVLDATKAITWDAITWDVTAPAGTTVAVRVRTGNTATPGTGWSSWRSMTPGALVNTSARYLQYDVTSTTSGTRFVGPALRSVQVAGHI